MMSHKTDGQERSRKRVIGARMLAMVLGSLAFAACDDPDIFLASDQVGQPAGALEGTVTYTGMLPCTEGGHVLGTANLLVLDVRLLPPPEGVGRSAASFNVVAGDTLFASVRGALTFQPNGARWCPDPATPPVTVSATWSVGPLAGGVYQVRGFFDRDGNFDPSFSISNLPTRGDVAGGAIENIAEVAAGRPPRYRQLPLGEQESPGVWQIGPDGAKIGEIAVTLGLPLPTERPIFHSREVLNPKPVPNDNPLQVVMPADFQLAKFDPTDPVALEQSFVRVRLGAGVPATEVEAASNRPFSLPVRNGSALIYTREDVDGNGIIDAADHVPDSAFLPSLYPMAVFTKVPKTPSRVVSGPVVISQGLTIYKDIASTASAPTDLRDPSADAIVAVRPSVICLDPLDVSKPGAVVITHETDKAGNRIVADEAALKAALSAKFRRPMELVYGCLPTGAYAMNVVYPTGQAWTIPNEAGICAASEQPATATTCGSRPRLGSQTAVLAIIAPSDPSYCSAHPAPGVCTGE
ncbi:hypothetical protein LZC95_29215 [Pendulispora brunnea]|uniref:Uncharacterized protein n=1 Tax=Pendulispora brunnea TaxID=2905690 RepID=A0ABZ2JVN6_9BACT